jgi:AcrR family transcriptional regulator
VARAEELYMRDGLKSVSMDDVARELGVSKKTLYQHVSTKKELIELVMDFKSGCDMAVLLESLNNSHDAIDEYLQNSRYFIKEMRKISPSTMYDLKKYYPEIFHSKMKEHVNHFVASIIQNLYRGMEEGIFRDDLMPEVIGKIYAQTILAITDSSLFPATEISIDRIVHQQSLYHLNAIVNDTGRERMLSYLKEKEL